MASESDDEELRQAIALSLQDERGTSAAHAIALDDDDSISMPQNESKPPNSTGFLGLNRKQMEEERLTRKRRASKSPPQSPRSSNNHRTAPAKRHEAIQSIISLAAHTASNRREMRFPRGAVKKTWALGHPRSPDVITLEEVFEKDDLQLAVLSSFQWDIPWLLAKLNISKTLLTLVMQAKDDATKEQYREETAYLRNLRLCFPNMDGQINCMHSKLMLLSHPTYLRLVVPTANLVSYDWGETGTMENMCFIVDLPRLPEEQRAVKLTPFGDELVYFLHAQGLEKSIVNSLSKFDFSATEGLAFVHTIGGAHTGIDEPWRRTGHCGLGRAVKALDLDTKEPIDIDFVTSSVGSLNLNFLSSLYLACKGDDGSTIYEAKSNSNGGGGGGRGRTKQQPPPSTNPTPTQLLHTQVEQHFRVYFPTHDTVRASAAGSAGTICFQAKWYHSPTFPQAVMRDCKSTRPGLFMHNKLILVQAGAQQHQQQHQQRRPSLSWAYLGSANCSESAWGAPLMRDRASKRLRLNCRNWECGVVLPAARFAGVTGEGGDGDGGLAAAAAVRPERSLSDGNGRGGGGGGGLGLGLGFSLPMVYPGERYGGRKPWFYAEE